MFNRSVCGVLVLVQVVQVGLVEGDQVEFTHGFIILIFTNVYYNEIVYLSLTSD